MLTIKAFIVPDNYSSNNNKFGLFHTPKATNIYKQNTTDTQNISIYV